MVKSGMSAKEAGRVLRIRKGSATQALTAYLVTGVPPSLVADSRVRKPRNSLSLLSARCFSLDSSEARMSRIALSARDEPDTLASHQTRREIDERTVLVGESVEDAQRGTFVTQAVKSRERE